MRVSIHGPNGRDPIALSIDDAKATVADLRVALGVPEAIAVFLDDRALNDDDRLVELELVAGADLTLQDPPDALLADEQTVVAVVGGVDSGRRATVTDGLVRVGREPGNDLAIDNTTVSSTHAEVVVTPGERSARDLGSHNGTWLADQAIDTAELEPESRLRLGSSTIAVVDADVSDRAVGVSPHAADEFGRILFNRPPRRPLPALAGPIELPPPTPDRTNPVFSIVAFIVPIVFAGVMVAVMGSWRFALFALLSPVMLAGNHMTGRRRVRKQRAGDTSTRSAEVDRFEWELDAAEQALRRRHRAIAPGVVEIRRRIELPSSALWERRLEAEDALVVGLGRGSIAWAPVLAEDMGSSRSIEDDVAQILARRSVVDDIEVLADLRQGPLGIVGDQDDSAAFARSIVLQAAAGHGPADLSIVVLTDARRVDQWSWVQWLPHAVDSRGAVRVLAGAAAVSLSQQLFDELDRSDARPAWGSPGWLFVVDDVALLHGRSSPVRRLLARTADRVFGVVLAAEEEQLPASTATVAQLVDGHGSFEARHPQTGEAPGSGTADLVALDTARDMAAALARFEDPELDDVSASVPVSVRAGELFGSLLDRPEDVLAQWERSRRSPELSVPVGFDSDGVSVIDLVADGPHGLVAGTTGAGKSELLRTLVAGLAAHNAPDDLVFVLIDYKGGSAFDRCAELPHVVGLVTDLDDHLAERALQSLEAELHHRERVLRDAGASDIIEYRSLESRPGPLPRLAVVIDEFATLRSELPDFVDALVGIAQRGRSLGVHLVLATQRPSGAVDANIRANTNLRIALRVQDAGDSVDVIDSKDAADIPRDRPGRAYVRRGAGDLVEIQTGYLSGPGRSPQDAPVRVAPIPVGTGQPPRFPEPDREREGSDLDRLVDVVVQAYSGGMRPRRPWLEDLEPLVHAVDAGGLESGDGMPRVLAIGDDPAHQRRVTLGWDPTEGNLAVFGALGSGVTTLLRSCIVELGEGVDGRPIWVYVSDHGAGGLSGIEQHCHVGCRLDEHEPERHRRLLTMLEAAIEERRAQPRDHNGAAPLIILVIDGVAGFLETAGAAAGEPNGDAFNRIVRDGPAVGVVVVVGANAPRDLPRVMQPTIRRQFVLELADATDFQALGIRTRTLPTFRPGRALVGPAAQIAQVIVRDDQPDLGFIGDPPSPVEELPASIPAEALGEAVEFDPALRIPIGVSDRTRAPVALLLRRGEHAVIAGPAGSGRTTVLRQIARRVRRADASVVLVGIAATDAPERFAGLGFDALGTVDELTSVLTAARSDERRWVIVVDDAEQVRDDDDLLNSLASTGRPGLTIVAAVRSAAVRSLFGHWTRHVRSSGVGVLLDPDNAVDGEVLGVRLPRTERLLSTPGRGYLVAAGEITAIQLTH